MRSALALLTLTALLSAALAGGASSQAAGPLTVTPTTSVHVLPSSTTTLTGMNISGDTTDTLQATVATDLGTLSISTTTGLTLAYNNSWTGTSSITFTGLQSDINAALATVSLVTSSTTGTAHVALTAMAAQAGFNYLASNQHFYEYVSNLGVTWTAADAAAKLLSFKGQPGYLATIPNSTVNTFISTKIANATNVWFGARSYEAIATDGSQVYATVGGTTYARVWRWTEGADESPIAGQVVSECSNQTGSCTFQNAGSLYSSWASGEPNNSGGSNTVPYAGEYSPVTNWNGTSAAWNDLSPTNSSSVNGYVVEFGGKTNADSSLGTGFSGVVTATSGVLVATSASVPSAPVLSATPDNASADLSWNPPSDGGAAITGYEVSLDSGATWNPLATSSSSAIVNGNLVVTDTATVTGLTNGTSASIQVRADNSVGPGTASNTATVTPRTVPGQPTGVGAVRGNQSAVVSFTAPLDNGGASITGYTITASPGGATTPCSASPCTVFGLTNGTPYTFTVHATNPAGDSAESSPSVAVTPATVPGAPTGVSAARGDGSASVSWTAPGNGGSPITGYTVSTFPGGATTSCSASPCTINGLTNGHAYTFSVHATNAVGDGAESGTSAPVTPAALPGAPTGVSAIRGDGAAVVSFAVPVDNGGTAITGYTLTASPGGATVTCSASPCTITGLANGTAYTFTVHATNGVGDGPESAPSAAVTPATLPRVPTDVSAVRGDGSAVVTFDDPADDGGSPITGYTVTTSPGGATTTCSDSPCTVTGLTNGSDYTFTVHATNDVGDGAESAATDAVTPAGLPSAPTGISITTDSSSATITFGAPLDDGGSPITSYTVTASPGGATVTCMTSPCIVTGLSAGTAYTFSVHATNGVGDGDDSSAPATTTATVPAPPSVVSVSRGNGKAIVVFAAPASNGGAPITSYTVTAWPSGVSVTCTTSPCVITGLSDGAPYTFTVHAANAVGPSPESAGAPAPPMLPKTFRIQVQFTVPAACNAGCVAKASLTRRSGGHALASRAKVKLPGGKRVRFYLTISRATLLKAPFATLNGKRVAKVQLHVWLLLDGSKRLMLRNGRIAVSIARMNSGALPNLTGVL